MDRRGASPLDWSRSAICTSSRSWPCSRRLPLAASSVLPPYQESLSLSLGCFHTVSLPMYEVLAMRRRVQRVFANCPTARKKGKAFKGQRERERERKSSLSGPQIRCLKSKATGNSLFPIFLKNGAWKQSRDGASTTVSLTLPRESASHDRSSRRKGSFFKVVFSLSAYVKVVYEARFERVYRSAF